MKVFPTKKYSVTLLNGRSKAIAELQKETISSEQFISNWNKQSFIGKIKESEFELKLSEKIYGAFCVFNGKLEKEDGKLKIEINKTFKATFTILFIIPIIGFMASLIKNGYRNSTDLIFPSIFFVLVIRFVIIELGFRIISKNGMNKLTKIIGIETKTDLENEISD